MGFAAMARAFECIPRQLCDNAGFDATNILNKLRQKHAQGEIWAGVDIMAEDVADNFEACVWEPSIVKINAITAASEAACLILSVDETVKNPRSGQGAQQGGPPGGMPMGRGRGRPMMGYIQSHMFNPINPLPNIHANANAHSGKTFALLCTKVF